MLPTPAGGGPPPHSQVRVRFSDPGATTSITKFTSGYRVADPASSNHRDADLPTG